MKIFLKGFISIILVCLFSFQINANDISPECEDNVEKAVVAIINDINRSEKEDADQADSYVKNIVGYFFGNKDQEYNERVKQFKLNSGGCLANSVNNDVAIKLVRILYGEEANKPIEISNNVINYFFDKDSTLDINELNESTDMLNVIPEMLQGFNILIFSVAVFLVSVIYGKSILSFLYEKNPNKLKNSSKNVSRIVLGLTLIAPLSFFSNYSMIQMIFLFLIIIGILLAKVVWFIISISISLSSYEITAEDFIHDNEVIESYSKSIIDNIGLHMCDLNKRELYLEQYQYSHDNIIDAIEENNYYKCLTENEDISDLDSNKDNSSAYYPEHINRGKACAIRYMELDVSDNYCGYLQKNEKSIELIDFKNGSFQSTLRGIAYDINNLKCKYIGGDQQIKAERQFSCVKMNVGSGEYLYDGETRKVLTENASFSNQREFNESYESILKSINQKASNFIISNKTRLKEAITTSLQSILTKDLQSFFSLYDKGFAVAGTIFYEKFDSIQIQNDLAQKVKTSYSVVNLEGKGVFQSLRESENSNEILNAALQNKYLIFSQKYQGMSESLRNNFVHLSANLFDEDYVAGSVIQSEFKEKREILKSWTSIYDNSTECIDDYSKCKTISINPFLKIMKEGKEMTEPAVLTAVGTLLSNKIFTFIYHQPSDLLDFISSLSITYLLIGLFFAVILPFIPFFTYASLFMGWIVQTLKVLIVSQLLSVFYIVPEDNEDFAGKEIKIYKLLLKTAIQPLFLIIGFLVAMLLANISITLINLWLSIMQDVLGLNGSDGIIYAIIYSVIGAIMYAVFITVAIVKSNEAISAIPQALAKWLDIEVEDEKTFGMVSNVIQSYVLPKIKGGMII